MEQSNLLNRDQLAAHLSVSPALIRLYLRDGLPFVAQGPGKPNLFDPIDVANWLKTNKPDSKANGNPTGNHPDSTPSSPSNGDDGDIEAAKKREIESRTALNELKYSTIRGKYVSRKAIHTELMDACSFIAQHMRGIADSQDIPEEAREAVRRAVDAGLAEFSEMLSNASKRVSQRAKDRYIRKAVQDDK
jgi:hypothetical protein